MFIEPSLEQYGDGEKYSGWIEVICGSMFSGKTEELIRRLNRAVLANQKVEIFKPVIDNRYSETEIVSHNKNAIRSTTVNFADDILLKAGDCSVVGIDEAQFFDKRIVDVCNELANEGKRVVVAGLDMDYMGRPFGPMPYLMAVAEFVTKVHAICMKNGSLANYSFRKVINDDKVLVGETESYEARCRKCFFTGLKNSK
ncbi:thymidine kinase [Mangrovivirga sp. M17]|uniref:Thymidine kinase n=1 Tax=Mangrovivirga halotolerans TaxID=2993936 RepID=A0ABT3RSR4_9BACT|nr:thymidine kinase [Mangrovivirga halotolerans]MCX2744531.1 thymidine kinase [Mangrovivirga halotolerans]